LGLFVPFAWGATYQVSVGDSTTGQAVFNPPTIRAKLNDTIVFIFNGNHTVTQTIFSAPCQNNSAQSTFDSGYLNRGQNFSVNVYTTGPIWIRCNTHCPKGMVAAINAPDSGDTFQQYQARANGTYKPSTSSTSSSPPTSVSASIRPTTSRGAANVQFSIDNDLVVVVSSLLGFILAASNL